MHAHEDDAGVVSHAVSRCEGHRRLPDRPSIAGFQIVRRAPRPGLLHGLGDAHVERATDRQWIEEVPRRRARRGRREWEASLDAAVAGAQQQ